MNSEEIIKKLVSEISKADAKKLETYEDRVKYWMKKFSTKEALKWNDKILDLENQYLKACLAKKKLENCYELESLALIDEKYKEKVIIWDDRVDNLVIDAIVVPSSYDITNSKDKELHNIYYSNGIKLRKKICTIMNGETLGENEVLITRAYGVVADYIMHVNYKDIKKSIINIMECARVNMVKTLVICLDNDVEDIVIAFDTILEYLDKYGDFFDRVVISLENKEIREKFINIKEKELV